MIDKNAIYDVTNRSGSILTYKIPDEAYPRTFQPGETKQITFGELEKLRYGTPGGDILMASYLQIQSKEAVAEMGIPAEPEYYMNEQQIVELIKNGSIEAFLDCLDFAPAGVIQLLKDNCIKLPVEDYNKRQAIKEKLNFDIDSAIAIAHAPEEKEKTAAPVRRTTAEKTTEVKPGRRVTVANK